MVVDAASFRLGEGVVGFGYLDEFFRGGFIATVEMKRVSSDFTGRMGFILLRCLEGLYHGVGAGSRILIGVVFLAEGAIGFLDLSIRGRFINF